MKTLLDSTPKSIDDIIASSFAFKGTTKAPVVPAISAYRADNLIIVDDLSSKESVVTDAQILVALEKVGIFDRKGAFLATGQLSKNILLKSANVVPVAPVVKEQQTESDDTAIVTRIIKENLDYSMLDTLLTEQPAIAKKLEKFYGYFLLIKDTVDLSDQLDKPISSIVSPRLVDESGYLLEVVKVLPATLSEAGHSALKDYEEPLKVSKVFTDLGYSIASRVKKDGYYHVAISKEVGNGAAAGAEKSVLESLEGFKLLSIDAPSISSFADTKKVIASGNYIVGGLK